jgi:hypothetical protein
VTVHRDRTGAAILRSVITQRLGTTITDPTTGKLESECVFSTRLEDYGLDLLVSRRRL